MDDRLVRTGVPGGTCRRGSKKATMHRRFAAWIQAGLWRQLHRAVLDELGAQGQVDRFRALLDTTSVR